MNIGTFTRSKDDDYPVAVDFSAVDVFIANSITSAVLSASDPAGLTLGTVSFATANVPTFRLAGGVAGQLYTVTITATNAATPPNVLCRSFGVQTEPC